MPLHSSQPDVALRQLQRSLLLCIYAISPIQTFKLLYQEGKYFIPSCLRRILDIFILTCLDHWELLSMGLAHQLVLIPFTLPTTFPWRFSSDSQNGSKCMWISCPPLHCASQKQLSLTRCCRAFVAIPWPNMTFTTVELLFPVRFRWPRILTHILTETCFSTLCWKPVPYTEILKEIYFSPRWNRTNAGQSPSAAPHYSCTRDSRIRKDDVNHYPGELRLWV